MFLGQFRQAGQSESQNTPSFDVRTSPSQTTTSSEEKAASADDFLKLPETKDFVKDWSSKTKNGEPVYTKRGINLLLRMLYPNYPSNQKILAAGKEILAMLGGMDGLSGFLMGWKAKSEGIIKAIKGIIG